MFCDSRLQVGHGWTSRPWHMCEGRVAMEIFRWNWDPWGELGRLRRDLEDAVGRYGRAFGVTQVRPPVNVYQDDDGVTVTAEAPGVSAENLSVQAEGEVLRISAKREPPEGVDDEQYHRRERLTGDFSRELKLPAGLDSEKVEAKLADGVLTVRLPKAEAAKPRKIDVSSG